jgi:hypothetical protein
MKASDNGNLLGALSILLEAWQVLIPNKSFSLGKSMV